MFCFEHFAFYAWQDCLKTKRARAIFNLCIPLQTSLVTDWRYVICGVMYGAIAFYCCSLLLIGLCYLLFCCGFELILSWSCDSSVKFLQQLSVAMTLVQGHQHGYCRGGSRIFLRRWCTDKKWLQPGSSYVIFAFLFVCFFAEYYLF